MDMKLTSKFEEIVGKKISKMMKEVVDVDRISDDYAETLFYLTSIISNIEGIKKDKQQVEITAQLSDAVKNFDMSKLELSDIKNMFKN